MISHAACKYELRRTHRCYLFCVSIGTSERGTLLSTAYLNNGPPYRWTTHNSAVLDTPVLFLFPMRPNIPKQLLKRAMDGTVNCEHSSHEAKKGKRNHYHAPRSVDKANVTRMPDMPPPPPCSLLFDLFGV